MARILHRTVTGGELSDMKSIVIVGSGVAGTVLARQLLANGDYQISMFEAGPEFHQATVASGSITWWAMTKSMNRSSMIRGRKTNISGCAVQGCS